MTINAFDDLDLEEVMNKEDTPPPPASISSLGKRARHDDRSSSHSEHLSTREEEDDQRSESSRDGLAETSASIIAGSARELDFVRRYNRRKKVRLDSERAREAEQFVQDAHSTKLVKIYLQNQELLDQLRKIHTSAPPFEPSQALITNIRSFAAAVLVSPRLASYHGSATKTHVYTILKTTRFDLPPNIENIPSDWRKVKAEVGEQLIQVRAAIKKDLKKSMGEEPHTTPTDIFLLTQQIAARASVSMTVPLCSHVALMRRVYLKDSGPRFWCTLDEQLALIREKSKGDPVKLLRSFKAILEKDIEKYGDDNLTALDSLPEDDVVDDRQQQVVDAIDASAEIPADDGDDSDDEEEQQHPRQERSPGPTAR
ncbi:hypothetical protein EVG20_g10687 [Dentipellis fragilis]|uniref:Uncharacterized protein n=1 Tax=Dentipellis fragilis TaxID=205917 RepID=A0A4Y9XPB2_9AGAM|nr:hypothetical protein EVG20_g10687 [Dentipellis fragilis]